jgi:RNA-directed DNA polymerase
MNSLQFKKYQLKKLCAIIGCQPAEILYITSHIDSYYKEWFEKKVNKASGEFKKFLDGTIKQRAIRPSLNRLKVIQSAIKNKILLTIQLPENIHGGIKKKSNITNAKPHQGHKFVFTTDLQDFYPSIKYKNVYHTFLNLGYSNHIAHWLTKLTTWKYELPQGASTSTHIANLVLLDTDKKLIDFCIRNNITYTRYIDDLTFSSQQCFMNLLTDILKIIKDTGLNISYRKTQYKGNQTITGIEVFNNYIDGPERIRQLATKEEKSEESIKPYTSYLNSIRRTNKNMKSRKLNL